jgi:hypothetical protein
MTIAVRLWTDRVHLWTRADPCADQRRHAKEMPPDGPSRDRPFDRRALDQRDLPDLVALHLDPDVSRYLGGIWSAEATDAYLAANLAHWDRHGFGLWIWRKPNGAFMSRAGIRPLTMEGVPEIEIAYALARGAWGQGYAGEITERLVEHALERLALPPGPTGKVQASKGLLFGPFAPICAAIPHVDVRRRRGDILSLPFRSRSESSERGCPRRFNRKKETYHGASRILHASALGSWRPLRPPDAPLEPEDGPLHLWFAFEHPHHRPVAVDPAPAPGPGEGA